jgi:hypothetical protein
MGKVSRLVMPALCSVANTFCSSGVREVGLADATGLQIGNDLLVGGDEGRLEVDIVVLQERT